MRVVSGLAHHDVTRMLTADRLMSCTCNLRHLLQVNGYDNSVPCPTLDITGGFQKYFDRAIGKTSNPPFDPYKNDVNFLLATWSLEEIGATGDKVGNSVS